MTNLICNEHLLKNISANLKRFDIQTHCKKDFRQAAVAITIVNIQRDPEIYDITYKDEWHNHAAILLTIRASKLKKHAGQWALPGGQIDAGENAEQAALRELEEEVGLKLNPDRIIGRLDDYSTRSGFTITPIVVWGGADVSLVINIQEVESVYRIPIAEFMRQDAPILEDIPESEHPVLMMPVGNSWIGAPTAAMVYQFREVAILGNHKRVAHYDQPYFAWK